MIIDTIFGPDKFISKAPLFYVGKPGRAQKGSGKNKIFNTNIGISSIVPPK
jgi:hypothetical protein